MEYKPKNIKLNKEQKAEFERITAEVVNHVKNHGIGKFDKNCPICQDELKLAENVISEIIEES